MLTVGKNWTLRTTTLPAKNFGRLILGDFVWHWGQICKKG